MVSLNVILVAGKFNQDTALTIIKMLPIFIGRIAENFTILTDIFNAKILFGILFTVPGMSFCMILIAKSLIIQPIARFSMVNLHALQDKKIRQ